MGVWQTRKYTPTALANKIDEYIKLCEDDPNKIPSRPDLLLFLGISDQTWYNYINNQDNKYTGYKQSIEKIQKYWESYYIQTGLWDTKKSVFCMFLLKQNWNGGYADRPAVDDKPKELKVTISSGGKDPFA